MHRRNYALAKSEFLKCVNRGYILRLWYQFLAIAAAGLGQINEEREYQKRAQEFG